MQRDRLGPINMNFDNLPGQTDRAVEHHNPIAGGAPDELLPVAFLALFSGRLARPFHEHFHLPADLSQVVPQANASCAASSSLFRRRLTIRTRHRRRSAAFVPGRVLYLKMKLFLNREWRTRSSVCSKSGIGLAAETDMKVARDRALGMVSRMRRSMSDRTRRIPRFMRRRTASEPLCAVRADRGNPCPDRDGRQQIVVMCFG